MPCRQSLRRRERFELPALNATFGRAVFQLKLAVTGRIYQALVDVESFEPVGVAHPHLRNPLGIIVPIRAGIFQQTLEQMRSFFAIDLQDLGTAPEQT